MLSDRHEICYSTRDIDAVNRIKVSNVRLGFCKKLNDESWIELMRIF